MPKPSRPPLPPAGAAYAVPLANGLWGGCRILRVGDPGLPGPPESHSVLVAAVDWVGVGPPTGNEPGFAGLLRLTHHAHSGQPAAIWVAKYRGPIPATFQSVGTVPPSADELAMDHDAWAAWDYIPLQVELQWQWDHDRDAVLKADARERDRKATADRFAEAAFRRELDQLTLGSLRAERPFAHWRRLWPAAAIARARDIFRDTIDQLVTLGPKPTLADAEPILRDCIEQFNNLDGTGRFVIETEEREDIANHFARMVHAAGLAGYGSGDLTERWRDW